MADDTHALVGGPDLPDGFTLEPEARRWVRLTHDRCSDTVSFVNATPERVAWYVDSHRCGPAGSGWQVGEPVVVPPDAASVAVTLRAATHLVERTPSEAFRDTQLYVTASALTDALLTALDDAQRAAETPPMHCTGYVDGDPAGCARCGERRDLHDDANPEPRQEATPDGDS